MEFPLKKRICQTQQAASENDRRSLRSRVLNPKITIRDTRRNQGYWGMITPREIRSPFACAFGEITGKPANRGRRSERIDFIVDQGEIKGGKYDEKWDKSRPACGSLRCLPGLKIWVRGPTEDVNRANRVILCNAADSQPGISEFPATMEGLSRKIGIPVFRFWSSRRSRSSEFLQFCDSKAV